MKKFLLAVLALVGFVVGALGSQQIQVPDSLPIGTAFPPANTWIRVDIGYDDPTNGSDPFHTEFLYNAKMGSLEEAVRQAVADTIEKFVPQPGTEIYEHAISVRVDQFVDEIQDELRIGQSPTGRDNLQQLVQVNGRWTFPKDAAEKVKLGFQGDIPTYAKGLTEVVLVRTDEFGNEYSSDTSPNGITDKTCSEYPGGSAYRPDMLMVPLGIAYSTYYSSHRDYTLPRGYYYLTFGTAKATWAKYDLQTGRKIGSNEQLPLRMEIAVVDLASVKLTGLSTSKISAKGWGLKLRVTGTFGKTVAIEYSDVVKGSWKTLTTVPLTYGWAECVDEPMPANPIRFYRVRQQ